MILTGCLPEEEWRELDPIRQSGYKEECAPWDIKFKKMTVVFDSSSHDLLEYIDILTKGEAPPENTPYVPIRSDEVIFYFDSYGISRPGSSRPPPLVKIIPSVV